MNDFSHKGRVVPGINVYRGEGSIDLSRKVSSVGIGVRVHFFDDELGIKRIPHAKFDRMYEGKSDEALPAYAGKRVKCAMSFLDLENRKPLRIRHTSYFIVAFDPDGKVDSEEIDRASHLAVSSLDFGKLNRQDNVLDLSPRIAQRKYKEGYIWEPTGDEVNLIVKDVFPDS